MNLFDEELAEMIAIRAWSHGDPNKIVMWGALHIETRKWYIAFVQSVANDLSPTPPDDDVTIWVSARWRFWFALVCGVIIGYCLAVIIK